MNIRPLHDRVALRRLEQETKSSGGIVIPDNAAEKPSRGIILAVGPGKTLDNGTVKPLSVKIGDTVVFGKYSGNEVKIDNEEIIVMREDDIMGIIE
ncbi:MAG: co-chaperone GroES [Gammaproteobacteria bacterium]|nr:co-chaperone GroES [Gammaproteobacteria bacterium]